MFFLSVSRQFLVVCFRKKNSWILSHAFTTVKKRNEIKKIENIPDFWRNHVGIRTILPIIKYFFLICDKNVHLSNFQKPSIIGSVAFCICLQIYNMLFFFKQCFISMNKLFEYLFFTVYPVASSMCILEICYFIRISNVLSIYRPNGRHKKEKEKSNWTIWLKSEWTECNMWSLHGVRFFFGITQHLCIVYNVLISCFDRCDVRDTKKTVSTNDRVIHLSTLESMMKREKNNSGCNDKI